MAAELELALVREALQTRLLVELMSNAMHKELVLKGGMAMRAVHGSVRYTKGIDLDADERASKERIQGVVKRSIDRTVSSGLIANANVTAPKQTDTTLRWKITGTQPHSTAPLYLTVEVSRRPRLIDGHVVEVSLDKSFNQTGRDVRVQVLDSQHIAVTKVLALTDPMRMAPRDLFDLNVLLEAGVEDPGQLLAQMPDAQLRLPVIMAELWPKIEAMSYEQFRIEVVPYLPIEVGQAIDSEAFDVMRVGVGVAVEQWPSNRRDRVATGRQMNGGGVSSNFKRPDGQAAKTTGDWKFRLLGGLSETGAPRIFTAAEFHNFVLQYRPGASTSTTRLLVNSLTQAGALRRVASGVHLNRRCMPPAELTEMAGRIRAGAVISLQSVLGECGFLNNPSAIVMAVVPTSANKRPNLGEVKTSGGDVFRFYGLAERFFPATDEDRWALYQPGRPCDMFRPEAALLHWLYLARMKRSSVTPPPVDVDMEQLDKEHLRQLAQRWQLTIEFEAWHDHAKSTGYGEQQPGHQVTAKSEPQLASAADGVAARERLVARLGKPRQNSK